MDLNIKTQILKKTALFKNLSERTIKTVAENCEIIACSDEKTFSAKNNSDIDLYVVATGKVTLFKTDSSGQSVPVFALHSGNIFGEAAIFAESFNGTITARADAKTVLIRIPSNIITILLEQEQTVAFNLIREMGVKIYKLYDKIAELVKQPTAASPLDELPISSNLKPVFSQREVESIKKMLYDHKVKCPLCGKNFTSPQVLSRYICIEKTDSDFCNHYSGPNPMYYEVAVCPECGYAFTESHTALLGPAAAEMVKKVLAELPKKDYNQVRDWQLALESFMLALKCLSVLEGRHSLVARLYLRVAWLYRYQQDTKNEEKYMTLALTNYKEAFRREKFDTRQELQLLYLIGELHNRLKNPKEAIQWFSRLTQHPEHRLMPAIVDKAREQWQNLRAEMKK